MGEPVLQLAAVTLPMAKGGQPMDLTVVKGEVWVVDGPSGSGKTTLFKVISGLLQPQAGAISLFGQDLNRLHFRELNHLRRRIGVLLEGDGLIPSWSVFENLALPWRYHDRLPVAELDHFLHDLLHRYQENGGLLHRVAATLTVEQRLRMALLRTLQKEPELLLLDNDGAVLHLPRLLKNGLMQRLDAQSTAMIVRGTPAILEALPRERLHLAIMRHGHLLAAGQLSDLRNHPDADVVSTVMGY
ncbi:MAG: ATP-binding cassette domain-containing protein [Magnetococcus sp. YQC-3]